jgi:hypothetical protein
MLSQAMPLKRLPSRLSQISTNISDAMTACRVTAEIARKSAEYAVPATTAPTNSATARVLSPVMRAATRIGSAPAARVAPSATSHLLIAMP